MLTMDEARGIAAGVWTRANQRRKIMDPQLCEDFADVLVCEVTKRGLDACGDVGLKAEIEALQSRILTDQKTWQTSFDTIQAENTALKTHQTDLEHVNGNLRHELKQAQLEAANLKTELDTLKLVPKNEVV